MADKRWIPADLSAAERGEPRLTVDAWIVKVDGKPCLDRNDDGHPPEEDELSDGQVVWFTFTRSLGRATLTIEPDGEWICSPDMPRLANTVWLPGDNDTVCCTLEDLARAMGDDVGEHEVEFVQWSAEIEFRFQAATGTFLRITPPLAEEDEVADLPLFLGSAQGDLALPPAEPFPVEEAATAGAALTRICHGRSRRAGWWDGTDPRGPMVVPTKLMLTVSELAEAMEGHRKNLQDDKLPHREMLEVELADAAIRIFDLAGALGFDLGAVMAEKLAFNAVRKDHTRAARAAAGGKVY
jgi:NTP pyrophosphatase (non-canonical NTP hydrolase)